MKILIIYTAVLAGILFASSDNKAISQTDDIQSDPVKVVEAVFEAARTGDFSVLSGLCDPTGANDGDTKQICYIGQAPKDKQDEFVKYFEKGTVVGEAEISGDNAKVKILFGLNGNKKEEFNLVRIDGKWYLSSL